jgi:hypothetical protein
MLGISQSEDHMTNEQLYKLTKERPISKTIRERQLQFMGHWLRMPMDEPTNIYALYQSKLSDTHRGSGRLRRTIVDQVSTHLCPDNQVKFSASEIARYARDKSAWKNIVAAPSKPDR